MNKVRIKNEDGVETEVVATAARVWLERGWTLVEDESKPESAEPVVDGTPEPVLADTKAAPETPDAVQQAKAPRATAGPAAPDTAKKE